MKSFINILFTVAFFSIGITACEEESFEKPENVVINLDVTDCSSYGSADGAIASSIVGGEPPYEYVWSNGATTENIANLTAGQYTLKVIYAGSAVSEASVIVHEPPGELTTNIIVTDASWYGGNDGAIRVEVIDGTAPFSYEWAHDENATSASIKNINAGIYEVTITDSSPKPVRVTKKIVVGQPEFVCGQDSITDVDGNKYPTVKIGDQCWTATNLVTKHKPDDPEVLIEGRFCQGTNCLNEYGAHYTWEAVMNGAETTGDSEGFVQGICPEGWHLPTRNDWKVFNSYLAIEGNGGEGTSVPNKIRGPDSPSGFDALYAGNWGYDIFTGNLAAFWSSTINENQPGRAYYRLVNNFPLLGEGHEDTRVGMSCRCMQDY